MIRTGGYKKRAEELSASILDTYHQYCNNTIEHTVYTSLYHTEILGSQQRMNHIQGNIQSLQNIEKQLQKQYGQLLLEQRRREITK